LRAGCSLKWRAQGDPGLPMRALSNHTIASSMRDCSLGHTAGSPQPMRSKARPIVFNRYFVIGKVRAAAELAEARRLLGEGSFSSIAEMKAHGYWGVSKIHALFETTYFAGLRKAGLPEE